MSAMSIENIAKKVLLQSPLKNKQSKDRIANEWKDVTGTYCQFLDLETSVALRNHAANFGFMYKSNYNYLTKEFEGIVSDNLPAIITDLENIDTDKCFLFHYSWQHTGVIVASMDAILLDLNRTLFFLEDELILVSSDFKKALIFDGDRTGSGDLLNYLSVSIAGDWQIIWRDTK